MVVKGSEEETHVERWVEYIIDVIFEDLSGIDTRQKEPGETLG